MTESSKKPFYATGAGITLIAVGAFIALLAFYSITSFVGAFNDGNRAERGLVAIQDNNKNVLSQYTTKIAEMAQVPDMQRDDLTKVLQATFEARNGPDGNQAALQFVREAYPGTLDNKLYENLQAAMEAGRNDFQDNQTRLIDQKRVYETDLGSFPKGFWLHAAGYPKIDLASIKFISNTHTNDAYVTGVDDGVKLRK